MADRHRLDPDPLPGGPTMAELFRQPTHGPGEREADDPAERFRFRSREVVEMGGFGLAASLPFRSSRRSIWPRQLDPEAVE